MEQFLPTPTLYQSPLDDDDDECEGWQYDHDQRVYKEFGWFVSSNGEVIKNNPDHETGTIIDPGTVHFECDLDLIDYVRNFVDKELNLPRTPKGNLKRAHQEVMSRSWRNLQYAIAEDLQAMLVHDPRYAEIIHRRVSEHVRKLVTRLREVG